MKILANQKIRGLFRGIGGSIAAFLSLSGLLLLLRTEKAAYGILVCGLCMGIAVLLLCRRYFEEQNLVMEEAVRQIREYIRGSSADMLECNEEGELYTLFHEVNSLVSILNAHMEREKQDKIFLKNTLSDISHQLKTPLAALNIYNGILQTEAEDAQTVREFTGLSEQELDRIEVLVQMLLRITKLDAGMIVPEKTDVRICELAEKVREHFCYRAKQEGKKLTISGAEEIRLVCDAGWMAEAISNLVKNALDHTKAGDMISVEWQTFASIVQIRVSDSGSGICPEDIHHIFKRFYRSRYSQDTQGIGLGLPLTKAIVEAHEGTIEVESTVGIGTTFILNFRIPTKL